MKINGINNEICDIAWFIDKADERLKFKIIITNFYELEFRNNILWRARGINMWKLI